MQPAVPTVEFNRHCFWWVGHLLVVPSGASHISWAPRLTSGWKEPAPPRARSHSDPLIFCPGGRAPRAASAPSTTSVSRWFRSAMTTSASSRNSLATATVRWACSGWWDGGPCGTRVRRGEDLQKRNDPRDPGEWMSERIHLDAGGQNGQEPELGLILVLLLTFTSYSASLSLSFPICKMELIVSGKVRWED